MRYPWNLDYWKSGEWQVVNERLHDMERDHASFNPSRVDLFRSLSRLSMADVRVVIIGQDPYPQAEYATGVAFSIPPPDVEDPEASPERLSSGQSEEEPSGDTGQQVQTSAGSPEGVQMEARRESLPFPPTLQTILREYSEDTGYPLPLSGDLSAWGRQGILLWNAIPSCRTGQSLSHDWDEYSYLTREIITKLSDKGSVVFAFLGAVARRFTDYVDLTKNSIIITSHPSPRGSRNSKTPFDGSRLFTTINNKLADLGQPPIDWRLDARGSVPT